MDYVWQRDKEWSVSLPQLNMDNRIPKFISICNCTMNNDENDNSSRFFWLRHVIFLHRVYYDDIKPSSFEFSSNKFFIYCVFFCIRFPLKIRLVPSHQECIDIDVFVYNGVKMWTHVNWGQNITRVKYSQCYDTIVKQS
jgi:hypothetical protein